MASDPEITQALHSLLRDFYSSSSSSSSSAANAAVAPLTSLADVVRQLESKLGISLSHKVDFIRSQIQQLFQSPPPPPPPQRPYHLTQPYPQPHFGPQHTPYFYPHPPAASAFHGLPSQYAPASTHAVAAAVPPSRPPIPVAPAARPVDPPKESAPVKVKRKGGAGGLNKLCGVSPELQTIVGQPALPRTEIVKQLWAYIRKHNLQDPSNKRKIICNDELKIVFETDCTDMFKMNKLLAKHILPLDPTKEPAAKKQKSDAETETETENKSIESDHIVKISDSLANFFGVEQKEMLLTEINKRIWEYINVNQLQDPQDTMLIQCDAKLQEIFGCESVHASKLSEILACQYIISS